MCFFYCLNFRTKKNVWFCLLTTGCCWLMQFTVNDRLISNCENHFFFRFTLFENRFSWSVYHVINVIFTVRRKSIAHFLRYVCIPSPVLLYLYCYCCNLWHWLIWNVITFTHTHTPIEKTSCHNEFFHPQRQKYYLKWQSILNNRWIHFYKISQIILKYLAKTNESKKKTAVVWKNVSVFHRNEIAFYLYRCLKKKEQVKTIILKLLDYDSTVHWIRENCDDLNRSHTDTHIERDIHMI